MNIRPPDVKARWDDNDVQEQAYLLAYNMLRVHEEMEELAASMGSKING